MSHITRTAVSSLEYLARMRPVIDGARSTLDRAKKAGLLGIRRYNLLHDKADDLERAVEAMDLDRVTKLEREIKAALDALVLPPDDPDPVPGDPVSV